MGEVNVEGRVVTLEREGAIGLVRLEEREFKNTFTSRFITDITHVFEQIDQEPEIKAVVMYGYDSYFCCGGTQDELLGILEGRIKLAGLGFADLALRCTVPVVSAMQGHALGGGLVFGSYADSLVLAEESIYRAIFMKYGFTPGMGGTCIIPHRFGEALGNEMLMSAKNYYGRELKQLGAPVRVVRRSEVLTTAMKLAREFTDKPRLSLQVLKLHLNRRLRVDLGEAVEREMKMHEITFAQPEVRGRIEKLFGA